MKRGIFYLATMSLVFVTSCSIDDVIPSNGDSGGDDGVVEDVLNVDFYNDPQNLSLERSNPDRLSLDSPGEFFEVKFVASPGENMSFVSMSSISNDWLFAPEGSGVVVFDENGNAILGDITDQIRLWDAGTEEENSLTFGGGNPDLREDDDNDAVRILESDVSPYLTADLVGFDVNTNEFTLRIYNLRGEFADPDPIRISPGAVAVHSESDPFFTAGEPQRGNGLQLLAERGDFSELQAFFAE